MLRVLPPMFKPVYNLICCKMWVVERATSLFNSFCRNVVNKLHVFCCPFFRTFKIRRRQRERHKSDRFNKQNNYFICTCITPFCTFLCRHCTTMTWKCLISCFIEHVNKQGQNFLSSFLTWMRLLGVQLQESSRTFDKVSANHFLSDVLPAVAVHAS